MHVEEDVANKVTNQHQVSMTVKSHSMNVELHSRIELHSGVELQNEVKTHFDFEISVHERDAEILDKNIHSDSKAKRQNDERRAKPKLSKYVRRHHPTD